MSRARFADQAKADLADITFYWKAWSLRKTERVLRTIKTVVKTTSHNPLSGRSRLEFGKDYRSVVAGDYLIFFKPHRGGIRVYRILHGARDISASDFEES